MDRTLHVWFYPLSSYLSSEMDHIHHKIVVVFHIGSEELKKYYFCYGLHLPNFFEPKVSSPMENICLLDPF
jgi:hypothetical protein